VPPQPGAVRWRRWDDDIVLRVESTASTHLLSPAGSCVFALLADHPEGLSMPLLAAALLDSAGPADLASLQALLLDLAQLGVLERADP
jgi:hypothetical protein